ncbi:MAG: hypothetical protein ABR581_05525 [Thermoleophilaceae bacterium]
MPGRRRGFVAVVVLVASAAVLGALAAPASAGCGGRKVFRAKRHRGEGRPPLVIGDSVVLGAPDELSAAGFRVDVRGCRQMSEGLRIMRSSRLPRIVVVALGTNWKITMREIRSALRIVGPDRVLAMVIPREEGGGSGSDAAVVRRAGRRYPGRVLVLDWVRYSARHGGWFAPDGIHLGPGGARGLTRLFSRVFRVVVPRRGPWTGSGAGGALAFSLRRGRALRSALIVSDGSCLPRPPRFALRRGDRASFGGRFRITRRKGGRIVELHGRFLRRGRARGWLRVRGGGCDSGRLRWSARPGRPRRLSGRWSGEDTGGHALRFTLPRDRLTLAFDGPLSLGCGSPVALARAIPIRSGRFSTRESLPDGSSLQVQGRFLHAGHAEGTWRRTRPGCDTGELAWSAGG